MRSTTIAGAGAPVLQSVSELDIALKILEFGALLLPLILIASRFLFEIGRETLSEREQIQIVQFLSAGAFSLVLAVGLAAQRIGQSLDGSLFVGLLLLYLAYGAFTLTGITVFTSEYDPFQSLLGDFESEDTNDDIEQVHLGEFSDKVESKEESQTELENSE
ncbi:hypothetical protein [Halobaculum magnesiiphilum]|uniref:Uncharacterized protein n=1 Tax=Halobaculum magnesiiphilum TaxID=1017351 RepID=A0A8T8WB44_9EURY|nr:hypothetical protein [Halobaculum magnesiiphilum]QZP37058.1 hypothetical protein K6T50_12265 [Halobaculum magnesiiphilum]